MRTLLRTLWRLLRLAVIAAIVVAVVRALFGQRRSEVTGEASWAPLADERPATAPVRRTNRATPTPAAAPTPAKADAEPQAVATAGATGWLEPVDGVCPASHPIKGNAQSKIFHVPGGMFYDRTVAERCYASVEAAEADGFRAAKR